MSAIYAPNGGTYGATYIWVQGDTINDVVTITSTSISAQTYTFWFTIKQSSIVAIPDANALFQASWTAAGSAGSLTTAIQASHTQTLVIAAGVWVFDFVMIDSQGNETTIMTSSGQPNNWASPGNSGAMVILARSTSSH